LHGGIEVFGGNVIVYQAEYYRRFEEWGLRGTLAFEEYLKLEDEAEVLDGVESFVNGRAPYALESLLERCHPRRRAVGLLEERCSPPFLRGWHNHFDNYGNYVPGFCAGVSFGDCRKLDVLVREGIRAEERPVLAFLMDEDLGGLLRFAKSFGYREAPQGYFSRCHLCLDIRRHLAATGKFAELTPRQFYDRVAVA